MDSKYIYIYINISNEILKKCGLYFFFNKNIVPRCVKAYTIIWPLYLVLLSRISHIFMRHVVYASYINQTSPINETHTVLPSTVANQMCAHELLSNFSTFGQVLYDGAEGIPLSKFPRAFGIMLEQNSSIESVPLRATERKFSGILTPTRSLFSCSTTKQFVATVCITSGGWKRAVGLLVVVKTFQALF